MTTSNDDMNLTDLDVIVLAGGRGTRLASVLVNKPKLLTPTGDRLFIEILLDYLEHQGLRRITLSLGYLAEQVIIHLNDNPRSGVQIDTVVEPNALGTGGGIALAARHVRRSPLLVMNGDTFLDADLGAFVRAATEHTSSDLALLAVRVPNVADFGSLQLGSNGCIETFLEKGAEGDGLVSAGVYFFKEPFVKRLRKFQKGSIETDVFQDLPPGSIYCHTVNGNFVDIGTPQRLDNFKKSLS